MHYKQKPVYRVLHTSYQLSHAARAVLSLSDITLSEFDLWWKRLWWFRHPSLFASLLFFFRKASFLSRFKSEARQSFVTKDFSSSASFFLLFSSNMSEMQSVLHRDDYCSSSSYDSLFLVPSLSITFSLFLWDMAVCHLHIAFAAAAAAVLQGCLTIDYLIVLLLARWDSLEEHLIQDSEGINPEQNA